jgi:tetratricopeptide (TPR) repeat protein
MISDDSGRRPCPRSPARVVLPLVGLLLTSATGCSRSGANADDLAPRDAGGGVDTGVSIQAMVTEQAAPRTMEGFSLLGDTLWRPPVAEGARERLEAALAAAQAGVESAPNDPDSLIWLGRRLAYLGRYQEAIARFTEGVQRFPTDARFLRHRGHRFLTVRELQPAITDFTRAAELERGRADAIEPDGAPNAAGIPVSTTQFNIWYHLALAHYLRGEFAEALAANTACLAVSANPDSKVATAYWRYLILRRLGRDADAEQAIAFASDTLTLLENDAYLALIRLYQGALPVDSVLPPTPAGAMDVANSTTAYGVSMWHLLNGRRSEADALWQRIVAGGQWAAFGSLAAEAELARARR